MELKSSVLNLFNLDLFSYSKPETTTPIKLDLESLFTFTQDYIDFEVVEMNSSKIILE
jgi:hypothetical protein